MFKPIIAFFGGIIVGDFFGMWVASLMIASEDDDERKNRK